MAQIVAMNRNSLSSSRVLVVVVRTPEKVRGGNWVQSKYAGELIAVGALCPRNNVDCKKQYV